MSPSIVVSAMESEKPLFGSLSSRQNDCLSTFIRCRFLNFDRFLQLLLLVKILRSGRVQLWRTESDPLPQSEVDIDPGGGGRAEPLPHGRRRLLPPRLAHLLLAQPLQWRGSCTPPLLQYSRPAHFQAIILGYYYMF